MARYEHLPIYKAALDLTVHLEKLVAGFSRYHKYTIAASFFGLVIWFYPRFRVAAM